MSSFPEEVLMRLVPPLASRPVEIRGYASLDVFKASHFDVVCMGEATLSVGKQGKLVPSGGALNASVALARAGLRVGLCAALPEEPAVREIASNLRAIGVDASGIAMIARPPSIVAKPEDDVPLEVPSGWSARLLLVSGLPSALEPLAALCRAARAARRAGGFVVVDVNARRTIWNGHDPRTMHGLLREADLVRCSTADLLALWTDAASLQAAMRPRSLLVRADGHGHGDALTAALCQELLRLGDPLRIDFERTK
jgi:sugar/nucleoside kinase (ribokinase family)